MDDNIELGKNILIDIVTDLFNILNYYEYIEEYESVTLTNNPELNGYIDVLNKWVIKYLSQLGLVLTDMVELEDSSLLLCCVTTFCGGDMNEVTMILDEEDDLESEELLWRIIDTVSSRDITKEIYMESIESIDRKVFTYISDNINRTSKLIDERLLDLQIEVNKIRHLLRGELVVIHEVIYSALEYMDRDEFTHRVSWLKETHPEEIDIITKELYGGNYE